MHSEAQRFFWYSTKMNLINKCIYQASWSRFRAHTRLHYNAWYKAPTRRSDAVIPVSQYQSADLLRHAVMHTQLIASTFILTKFVMPAFPLAIPGRLHVGRSCHIIKPMER